MASGPYPEPVVLAGAQLGGGSDPCVTRDPSVELPPDQVSQASDAWFELLRVQRTIRRSTLFNGLFGMAPGNGPTVRPMGPGVWDGRAAQGPYHHDELVARDYLLLPEESRALDLWTTPEEGLVPLLARCSDWWSILHHGG